VASCSDTLDGKGDARPNHPDCRVEWFGIVSQSLLRQRARTVVLGLFAFLALALACVGIYGVIAYSVAQRANEIGVRIALGAARKDVLGLVVGQALRLSLAGIGAGVVLAFALTRFLSGMLFGIRPTDPATFLLASGLIVAMTLLSSYIPAARASRIDPIQSLRAQ
jgi:putative ABC transport system permease protein